MANYKKAPKLYHDGDKKPIKGEPVSIIPLHIQRAIFNSIDGKCGNRIKLILTLLGTIGNGSFGISEGWIIKECGFNHSSYIRARKELVNMGWITLTKNEIRVDINAIIKYHDDTKFAKEVCHDDDLGCHDEIETYRDDTNEAYHDDARNKEEYINNKEYNKYHDDTNENIKISRREDLAYILKLYKLSEENIINIIKENKIDDADDFVNLLAGETKDENPPYTDGKQIVNIQDVISDYFKFHNLNIFKAKDTFRLSDILSYASKEDDSKILKWYLERGGRNQSEKEIKDESEANLLCRIEKAGNKFGSYYFWKNSKHK